MVTIWRAPFGANVSGVVDAGDPTPADVDPRLVTLLYPWPQGPTPTYLSLNETGVITPSATIGANERFQFVLGSTDKDGKGFGWLVGERNGPTYNGPLQLGITYGLLG